MTVRQGLKMNEEFCDVLTFTDWDDLRKHFDDSSPSLIFRGQRCSDWPLRSSLERAVHAYDPKDKRELKLAVFEKFFIFQFKRRAHNYLSPSLLPKDDDDLEWLALMQHHGAPTRLLDFTQSPYVASFFALENAESKECAVWAIDKEWYLEKAREKIELELKIQDTASLRLALCNPEKLVKIFPEVFLQRRLPLILAVEPFRMNERLTAQQGCFLCPGDVRRSFEENLLDSCEPEEMRKNVQKLVIHSEVREDALYDLYSMNVNRASLFPGIDGFAQSLKHQLISVNVEQLSRIFSETNLDERIRRFYSDQSNCSWPQNE